MTRLAVLVVLTAAAIAVAYLLQRRRPEPPTAPSYRAPKQVDRADFVSQAHEGSSSETSGGTPSTLLAVFASTTCNSCPKVWEVVSALAGPGVDTERIDVQADPDRHARYKIDGVPTTLVIDPDGVVTNSFFGVVSVEQLESALP